jgi:hypothetical protein
VDISGTRFKKTFRPPLEDDLKKVLYLNFKSEIEKGLVIDGAGIPKALGGIQLLFDEVIKECQTSRNKCDASLFILTPEKGLLPVDF